MCEIEITVDGELMPVVDSIIFDESMEIVEIRAYKG